MIFSGLEFLFLYLPAAIIIYFLIPAKFKNISRMKAQISHRQENFPMFAGGVRTFICGLCKKAIFAYTAASVFLYIKALPEGDITVAGAWLGLFFFGLYVYFEISGYLDMALGLGKMFGFYLPDMGRVYLWALTLFGFLIFAFEDMRKGFSYFGRLFGFSVKGLIDRGTIYDILRYLPFLIPAIIGCTPLPKKFFYKFTAGQAAKTAFYAVSAALLFICAAFLVDSGSAAFLPDSVRDYFADVKVRFSYAFMQNENKGVVIAKDGYLIPRFDIYSDKSIAEKSFDELGGNLTFGENMTNIKNNCAYINEFAENINGLFPEVQITFASPPRKIDAMTNKLPILFPADRHEKYFLELEKYINPKIYCSLLDIMKSHNEQYIYYKTDHHWTTLGAYCAYFALGEKMGYEPLPADDFIIETATEDFYGVIWPKAGAKWIKPDKIEYYKTENEDNIYVTSIHTANEPIVLEGFYDREKLGTKDKYASFLGGINSHISVAARSFGARKKLLLIADSFGQSLAPFLARHYDLEIIDTRFFNDNIRDFIAEYNITDILILVNMENFSTQNNLVKLMRK